MPTPNPIDLTWLAAVKGRAEVAAVSDDQQIQDAITAFSQWILDYCGRSTLNSIQTFNEIYNGNGNQRLFLRNFPIQALIQVVANGVQVPQSFGFNSWGVFIEQSQKSIAIRGGVGSFTTFPYPNPTYGNSAMNRGPVFFRGIGNIQVQYNAGYPSVTITNEVDMITGQTITLQTGPWVADGGVVFFPSLLPLALVPNSPGPSQYAVSNGLYVFNVADEGKQVAVTYNINRAPADLEYAVRNVVALNYKRKAWQGLDSRAVAAGGTTGTTRYSTWTWPPEYDKVFEHYKRLGFS